MMWCMQRTNIYLTEEQTRALDDIARVEGASRAEVIRRLIDRSLGGNQGDVEADLAAIGSTAGVLSDVDAPERGQDARAAHLDRVWRGSS